jgi:hypothetical protein
MADPSLIPEALSMPDPREELISRVAGGTDRTSFSWSGRESVRELERTLAIIDRSLDSFESILDFGCGCGLDAPLASVSERASYRRAGRMKRCWRFV